MKVIELCHVTAGYGGLAAVHDVSLGVEPGEVVALLGANGSGKTTTTRAVCGLTSMHGGAVVLDGTDVTRATPRDRARRGLATVPDERGVFTQLTVAENLLVGTPRRGAGLLLDEWFPDLAPLVGRRAGLLSGGEQTLLALARALASRPRALVVDELTAGLAPATADAVLLALRRTATEWGTGVLLAEQNARLALETADRAVVLRRGRVALEDTSADVVAQPGELEATYLGDEL